ncbi:MAG TPA: glycogen synthase GlgA [Bacteroidales bacterium]|nr:glycogen synthase GlgA [Bacteroidales bacterium]
MAGNLNILMVSAECAPFAKSGGLGDVVGALPQFIVKAGHRVNMVMPLYSQIDRAKHKITPAFEKLDVPFGNEHLSCSVYKSELLGNVPVYFLEHHDFFSRQGLYHDNAYNDFPDNPLRFAFLSKAALQLCYLLNFKPDIVHANDWHTAVLPAFLKKLYNDDPVFDECASVLTIHNIAYQGRYNRSFYFRTGLGAEDFTQDKFEHYGDVNFLKGGIHFADVVNTVSPGYAVETRTATLGYGLEYFLNLKGEDYTGIINGADYDHWNPETDKLIPANYRKDDLKGKAVCKTVLQKLLGLQESPDTPLVGIVSRLVEQKGFHIVAECIEEIINGTNVQFAILGAGDTKLERFYGSLPQLFPGKVGTFIGYDNELAHLIEAGSDFFLMPSIYEPCGLNQIYSLRYGTLPIVRATGGLNDTIINYNQATGEGTGFKFLEPTCQAASETIKLALDTYYQRRPHFEKLVRNAMEQHFSWDDSAMEYIKLYRKAKKKHAGKTFDEKIPSMSLNVE